MITTQDDDLRRKTQYAKSFNACRSSTSYNHVSVRRLAINFSNAAMDCDENIRTWICMLVLEETSHKA